MGWGWLRFSEVRFRWRDSFVGWKGVPVFHLKMYTEKRKPWGCSHHYLTIVLGKKSCGFFKKPSNRFKLMVERLHPTLGLLGWLHPTPVGCPLDEENEYWLKRYGHKRWFPKYVDQSGAPGRAEGWIWLEGLEGLDTTCPKNPTENDGRFFHRQWKKPCLFRGLYYSVVLVIIIINYWKDPYFTINQPEKNGK